jgi:hypothetical protein
MSEPTQSVYEEIGNRIGALVAEKNAAYGDSFGQASKILEVLYVDGIRPDQYCDALAIVRVIDKLFRLANRKDAFGESPWEDICGYAILGVANDVRDLDQQNIEDESTN